MPLTDDMITAFIEAVREVARDEILPRFRNLSPSAVEAKTGPMDLVTEADRAAEARLTEVARELLPGCLVVGEEAVEEDGSILEAFRSAELAVVIDPVDGTWNFASGVACFGVILAVVERGETIFGLLYDPVMDDWIMATRGGGAWFCRPGRAPERLSGPAPLPRDQIHAFVPLNLYPRPQRAAIAALSEDYGRALTLRCSCHEYRLMATGHAALMISPMVKPWDHAAGVLVVQECGGKVWSGGQPGYSPAAPRYPLVVAGQDGLGDEPARWQGFTL
ncbi:fructose-1,6-bisphosphatase [Pseudooceanicola antarcticus]|nr:inositol monophosphatase [Pseudooceanicola antarcticus]SNY51261.1 fructose-1,6-bisphosphatase [Pseudooceanicola antarcticus]